MPKGANSKVYIRGQKAIEYGSNKNPDPKHCLNLSCFMDCWLTLFVDSCLHIVFLGLHNSHCCFSLTAHCVWLIAPLRWEHAFFACTLYFLLTAHCVSSILCVSRMFVVLILTTGFRFSRQTWPDEEMNTLVKPKEYRQEYSCSMFRIRIRFIWIRIQPNIWNTVGGLALVGRLA